ncbi:axin-1 [Aplysia californica]|uniref:Axin-1 n=1 Tax=Aplysia californica TaxID=6500 RepID=A0ABM1AC69_APLCA|nr:axin-1 [Aplysia californica]
MLYCPRAPPSYPAHVSYAPVSAQDSEIQSLSSDALTDDTISVTDSSLDGYPLHLRKKHPRKAMKSLAQQNREHRTGLAGQIIPRTEHAPKDRNIAETDPKRFADLLMEKLSKVLEEREADAKVEEKLRSINVVDKSQSEEEKLVTSFAKHNTSASFMPLKLTMEEETAESILDQHCSRIWASSSHHTPSYSPPGRQSPPHGKSPERHKDPRSRAKGMSSSSGSNATPVPAPGGSGSLGGSAGGGGGGQPNLGGRGYHHHHHKKRDFGSAALSSCDSGLPDDRGNLISCGTETHRHIHHHHHHHHSSRDSAAKKSLVEMEAQTSCGLSAWRAENPQAFVDFPPPSGEHPRGRISARKATASGLRKGSETSSNIDSGVSGMYNREPLRVPPNWNNPTGEKVMKWMLDSETVQEVTGGPDTDRSSSSHKRSHRLNQSTGSAQQSRPSSRSKISTRSTSVERGGAMLSAWGGTPAPILPSQPFVQDSSMPLPTPPNPTTQLEEAKRRLETQSRTTPAATASPVKSKSFTGSLSKEKSRPPPGAPPVVVPPHTRTLPAARNLPSELDTSGTSQTLDSRLGRRAHTSAPSSLQPSPSDTIIGIYMGQEPIPYRHQLPGRAITLAQIKTLVTKRGPFKYFFKRDSDEFGDGAVFEEITEDSTIVPMWQGKIVVKVEKLDT